MLFRRRDRAEGTGRPDAEIEDGPPVFRAAVLGADLPHVRPDLAVEEGDAVRAGQVLLTDRRQPQVAIVAPVSGLVEAIRRGPRRSLSALVIRRDESPPLEAAAGDLRQTLLSRGMWPAFRTRPFGRIPRPEVRPDAIFVTATRASPEEPDPRAVLANGSEDFRRGAEALADLTDGPVHVCQAPGAELVPPGGRVDTARFTTGSASAHIQRLHPVTGGGEVWTIGYQDVAAIGHLLRTGRYLAERVVSVAGPGRVRLFRTVLGASLQDLTADIAGARPPVMSGPAAAGREAAFLGRYHLQVTLGAAPHANPSRLGPIMPVAALEGVLPVPTLPVPLMRALSIGDAETAERLGCRGLVEEDMAELTRSCTSGADYGRLLRRVLDELAAA